MEKKSRKELQEEYKQLKTYMGVIKVMNKINGKIYIAGYPNLKNKWVTLKGQLDMGMHANFELQKDWKEMGEEAFTYEVLEEKKTDDITDVRFEAKHMERQWLEKLTPYEGKGYNKPPKD
jgi:hypothetical protein